MIKCVFFHSSEILNRNILKELLSSEGKSISNLASYMVLIIPVCANHFLCYSLMFFFSPLFSWRAKACTKSCTSLCSVFDDEFLNDDFKSFNLEMYIVCCLWKSHIKKFSGVLSSFLLKTCVFGWMSVCHYTNILHWLKSGPPSHRRHQEVVPVYEDDYCCSI